MTSAPVSWEEKIRPEMTKVALEDKRLFITPSDDAEANLAGVELTFGQISKASIPNVEILAIRGPRLSVGNRLVSAESILQKIHGIQVILCACSETERQDLLKDLLVAPKDQLRVQIRHSIWILSAFPSSFQGSTWPSTVNVSTSRSM
jgi:hypothetical protein